MPSTTYIDVALDVASLEDRTDESGTDILDVNGAELRLYAELLEPGLFTADAYDVTPGAGLSVDVGTESGADLAVVEGTDTGQGKYLIRIGGAVPHNIPLEAADLSSPRIDSIYLVMADNLYDLGGLTLGRLALRTGDPAGSPSAPGPDGSWTAYLKLADISVQAGATSVNAGNITATAPSTQIVDALVGHVHDAVAHSGTTGQTADDHHDMAHAHDGIDGSGTVANVNTHVFDSGYVITGNDIVSDGTGFHEILSLSLSIPAEWNSWMCIASGWINSYVAGGTERNVNPRITLDGTVAPTVPPVGLPGNNTKVLSPVAMSRSGLTTTGTRVVLLEFSGVSGVTVREAHFYAHAIRTS